MNSNLLVPYQTGNYAVDIILWGFFVFILGLFMGWGWRVAGRFP